MSKPAGTVAIVDYGLGNLFSITHACGHAGLSVDVTDDVRTISSASAIILPGVGAFGIAMEVLRRRDLVEPIRDLAAAGVPIFGICLGMQLLMEESQEFGRSRGLGLLRGGVVPINQDQKGAGVMKVPHVGWNALYAAGDGVVSVGNESVPQAWNETLLRGLPNGAYMYFVHSFVCRPDDAAVVLSTSRYHDVPFCSSLRQNNIFACQFHPERSGPAGLVLYDNLAAWLSRSSMEDPRVGTGRS